jgi:hypothetical protein
MPKSRPSNLDGRENTPEDAEIAPKDLAGETRGAHPDDPGVPLFVARSAATRPTPALAAHHVESSNAEHPSTACSL